MIIFVFFLFFEENSLVNRFSVNLFVALTSLGQNSKRHRNHGPQKTQFSFTDSVQVRVHAPGMQQTQQQLGNFHRRVWLVERPIAFQAVSHRVVAAPALTLKNVFNPT